MIKIKYNGNDRWFYFNSKGQMQVGWQQIDGKWYYFEDATGAMLANGKYKLYAGGIESTYHFNSNGVCDSSNCNVWNLIRRLVMDAKNYVIYIITLANDLEGRILNYRF